MRPPPRLFLPFYIILCIFIVGVLGFIIIEEYSLLDAIYMTVITIATIGYHEVKPLSTLGKLFNIGLILSSLATFAYALAKVTQYVVEGEINKYFKTRRLMSAIHHLKDHVIICGFGRNGQQAAATLRQQEIPFVVIECNEALLDAAIKKDHHLLYIKGNATDDEMLQMANISTAKALISTLPVDSDNVFIVLSARSLNSRLAIISRASENSSYNKLLKAGANNVIMPDKIGGAHMAGLVSKPDVVEFVEYLGGQNEMNVQLSVVTVGRQHRLQTIGDVVTNPKVNVIGLRHVAGHYEINPPASTPLDEGMKIFILSDVASVRSLQSELSLNGVAMA